LFKQWAKLTKYSDGHKVFQIEASQIVWGIPIYSMK